MPRSCAFHSLTQPRFLSQITSVKNSTPYLSPTSSPLDEERNPDYDPKRFYPARIGDTILKYQIISKLGWGMGSTVWLAKDMDRFV